MPTQLIDPFDREIRRRPRRNDGFSDDGLSYSVANDFGKQWGDAMAQYEARTAAPRNDAFGTTLAEDRPDNLRHQLLDPLIQRFESPNVTGTRTPAPRTYKFGNQVVSVDPLTGQSHQVFSTPEKPDTRPASFDRSLILGKISALRQLASDPLKVRLSGKTPEQIDTEIKALEDEGRGIYTKPSAVSITPVAQPTPSGSINGNPLATAIPGSMQIGDFTSTPAPKHPTKAIAKDYVRKYGAKAHDKLKADGFDLSSYAD